MTAAQRKALRAASFIGVVAVVLFVTWPGRGHQASGASASTDRLLLYCAAGVREPVQAVIRDYQREFGVTVDVQYGGSGTLLSSMEVARLGDLYLSADAVHMELALTRQLVQETMPVARQHLVLAVPRGNPAQVRSLADLVRPGLKVAYPNPEVASAGKAIRAVLDRAGLWAQAKEQATVFKPTVNEVVNDVVLQAVDVGVVWDPLLIGQPTLEAVHLPELTARVEQISIGVLTSSRTPTRALHFARYLSARDRGLMAFAKLEYLTGDGDRWADQPLLTLFSGSVNRIGIEATLREFEQREGCIVRVNYNGCGVLVAQMDTLPDGTAFPDAYLACDLSFLDPVAHRFQERVLLSETDVMIAVAKDNPHGIRTLADLTKPGLRVGLGNVEQSTLGALTKRILDRLTLTDLVEPNVRSRVPTADLLVTQLVTGSLDAVVVYRANAMGVQDRTTLVRINLPEALAIQPFAVAKRSEHAQLTARLLQALRAPAAQQRYTLAGFRQPIAP